MCFSNPCHRPSFSYGSQRQRACAVTGGTEASITFGRDEGLGGHAHYVTRHLPASFPRTDKGMVIPVKERL